MPIGKESGFTYLFLLFIVAMGGVLLAAGGQLWWMNSKRDKEEELLFAGRQIRSAIEAYHLASTQGPRSSAGQPATTAPGAYPRSLDDLLEDRRRYPPLRHLRRVYVDPMTAGKQWGLLKQGDAVVGVYSLSEERPIRTSGFLAGEVDFARAASYRDWQFKVDPDSVPTPHQLSPAPRHE